MQSAMTSSVSGQNMVFSELQPSNVISNMTKDIKNEDNLESLVSDINSDLIMTNDVKLFDNDENDMPIPNEDDLLMMSMKLCSNCLNDFDANNEESFENDLCGHILCVKCRFVQDNVCKLCKMKEQEELDGSVALDLSTGCSDTVKVEFDDCDNSNDKVAEFKKMKKLKLFVVPNYIDVLSRDPPKYKCTICKRTFHYKLQAKYHEACATGQRPLQCDLCDKTFIKKSHLEYHTKSHLGNKPFICDICNKGFIQKSKLTRHMITHSGNRSFKCEICDLTLTSNQHLQIHLRSHSGERPFPCKLCRRTFSNKNNLKIHELKHTGLRNFVCEDCGKQYKLNSLLRVHRRTHLGEKHYKCTECNFSFVTGKDLNRHMQKHTVSEPDYECSICIRAFRRKDNLERHMKNAHPETISKYGRPRQIVSVVKVNNNIPLNLITQKSFNNSNNTQTSKSNSEIKNKTDKSNNDKLPGNLLNKKETDMPMNVDNQLTSVKENLSSLSEDTFTSPSLVPSSESSNNLENKTDNKPKCQKVSVISCTKTCKSNNTKKNSKPNNITKKSENISPYRLITPLIKSQDEKGRNCVPTITKVTHIVHTGNNGVSNIKTVITTRDAPEKPKKIEKIKDNSKSNVNNNEQLNSQRGNSVIKYVPKSTRNHTEMKHKCYRILKNSNNFMITTSNKNLTIPPSININENSLTKETVTSVRNIPFDVNNYVTIYPTDSNTFNSDYLNSNASYENFDGVQSDNLYEVNKTYQSTPDDNLNSVTLPCVSVSDSCILSNNVIDDSMAPSLYLESDNNVRPNENDYITTKSFIENFKSNDDSELNSNNNFSVISNICDRNQNPIQFNNYCNIVNDGLNYDITNSFSKSISDNDGDLILNNDPKSSTPVVYIDNIETSYKNVNPEFSSLNNIEFRDCTNVLNNVPSSLIASDVNYNKELSNISNPKQYNQCFDSNGLFTLAKACERANSIDLS